MEDSFYAPIIIPTLNRYEHFVRCFESLENCTGANKTELYIGLDYPPAEKYIDGWRRIKEYLSQKEINNGFKNIIVLARTENFGAVKNIEELQSYISKRYDRFIFTEDDNEFAPNFLDYINKGLEKFKDSSDIYAICGYNYPIDMNGYGNFYYFSREYSAWGCGYWTEKNNKVKEIIRKEGYLADFIRQEPISTFIRNNFRLLPFVRYINEGYLGDVYITTYLQTHGYRCVFPTVSLVRNWGHDGTGVNCHNNNGLTDKYKTQTIQTDRFFDFEGWVNRKTPKVVENELKQLYKQPLKSIIKSLVLLLHLKTKKQ